MKEKLAKLISRAGIASRRKAEQLILEGRVSIDGKVVRNVAERADPDRQTVAVGRRRLSFPGSKTYILLNKPRNVMTTKDDPEGRRTIYDFLPPEHRRLFYVGRLDFASEGLILMTDDGEFAQRLAHPRFETTKVYEVKLQGGPDPERIGMLKKGVRSEGKLLKALKVRVLKGNPNNFWLEIVLAEGKRHAVRRLCEGIGYRVLRLKRVSVGPFRLAGLPSGTWRSATRNEVRRLLTVS